MTRPTILFVETGDVRWYSLSQFAALMRRHGCRTLRVCDDRSRRGRLIGSLVFGTNLALASIEDLATCPRPVAGDSIIDVQYTEWAREAVRTAAAPWQLPAPTAHAVEVRSAWMDKLVAARRLRAEGIPVPDSFDGAEIDPEDAVRRLGSPVVIKRKVGAGGHGMFLAERRADFERAWKETDGGAAALVYERFHRGRILQYAAVVGPDGVEQEAVLESRRSPSGRNGPSVGFTTVDDAAMTSLGRRVVDTVGVAGLINIDVIRDDSGIDRVVDVNPRCWHSLVALRSAGVDFAEGYLHAMGLRPDPPATRRPRPDVRVSALPDARATGRLNPVGAMMFFVLRSWRYLAWLGPRYFLAEFVLFLAGVRDLRHE